MGFVLLAVAGFFSFIFVPVQSAYIQADNRVEDAGYRLVWGLGHHEIDIGRVWVHVAVLMASSVACFYFSGNRDPK